MADILSQDEIDLLLNAAAEGELAASIHEDDTPEGPELTAHDFRRPERVSKEQLKGLQDLFEAFARELGILFPPFLRTVARVDLISIDQLTYDEFVLSVARPTALTVIDMSPLEGHAVLELSPALVFPIIDRVLGGKVQALRAPRELTEIEGRIVTRVVTTILDALRRSWASLIEFRAGIVTLESDPLAVQIVAGSEMVVRAGYEVHITEVASYRPATDGETSGAMNFCIPVTVLNPILAQISQQTHFVPQMAPEVAQATRQRVRRSILGAKVPVDVILGRATLPLHAIARLKAGDIVPLDSRPDYPVTLEVGGVPRFRIRPGRQGKLGAVQIVGIIRD